MHPDEKTQLEHQQNIAAFKDAMECKIGPHLMEDDGEKFKHRTVQLLFDAFLAGGKPNPAKVLGQQLYAELKAGSKYEYQIGWMELRNAYPFPIRFEVDRSGYVVKGGIGGCYRIEDVDLLFKRDGEFHRI